MKTVQYQGVEFPISDFGLATEQEALVELAVCAKHEKKLFCKLQHASGLFTRKVRATAYLASGACRYVAMVEQAKDLVPHDRLPLSVYRTLAC